jgi:Uma2 family endonuclease
MGQVLHRLSYVDYLARERETGLRHGFLDGRVWLRQGGSPRHSKLKTNPLLAVGALLGDGPCQPYDSDLKVRNPATGLSSYPDLTIVCGPLQRHPEDRNAVTNPAVWFEVLSPSTEAWDRGAKFAHGRELDSLQAYVLVNASTPRVEVYTRGEGGAWILRAHGPGTTAQVPTLVPGVDVDRLYRNLPEEPPERTAPS